MIARSTVGFPDQPLESIATALVIFLLVIFAILDMSILGVSLVERAAYVVLYAGTVLAGFVIARTVGMDQARWALVAGWFLAFCRNFMIAVSVFMFRLKAELNQSRDFLDHI